MKYVVMWEPSASRSEESGARSLQVFGKWSPPEGATFHEFVGRIDGGGGFAVIETDDVQGLMRDAFTFGAFFDWHVYPVVEIGDVAAAASEAVEFLASVS